MKATRFIWFIIMIAAGVAIGLYYTWIINPVEFVDATFYDLRQDYKADYILMTAEIYNFEPNLFQTMIRLDRLLEESPEAAVENAIRNAGQLGYSETDIDMMYQLNDAIGGNIIENPQPEDIYIEFDQDSGTENLPPANETVQSAETLPAQPAQPAQPTSPGAAESEPNPFADPAQPTDTPSDESNPFGDFNG